MLARYLSVKRKDCPYFSGIISRSLPHVMLEAAEMVGINLANELKSNGAVEILAKAKVGQLLRECMRGTRYT